MARGYPGTVVAVLCIVSFFVGRFLQIPGLPEAGRGPTVHKLPSENEHRKSLIQVEGNSKNNPRLRKDRGSLPLGEKFNDPSASSSDLTGSSLSSWARSFTSFEELIEASGMLANRPVQQPGASGHSFYTVQPMQLLSWYPRAYLFPKFMDLQRCQHVITIAERRLAPSGLALKPGETLESTREIRTSQGTFMGRRDDPDGVLAWIEDKIAVLTGIPTGHGEDFNILRYENGQHYDSHFDVFTEEYGKQTNNRVATVLVYLSDVEEGGETSFLFEGKGGTARLSTVDYKKCDTGIKVKPKAGDALLFWSMDPDGHTDKHSLHGGCPVVAGTKWTATKWIHAKCVGGQPCLGVD